MSLDEEPPTGFFDTSDDDQVYEDPQVHSNHLAVTEQLLEDNKQADTDNLEEELQIPPSPTGKRLFLPDSDDEDYRMRSYPDTPITVPTTPAEDAIDVDSEPDLVPQASGICAGKSPSPDAAEALPSTKSMNLSVESPKKKRRISPGHENSTTSSYFGTFLVPNAWSTAKGTGYIKPGESILIERDGVTNQNSSKNNVKKSNAQNTGKKKQQTLSSMMKPTNLNKRPPDTAVRITNTRGFEFGRLPHEVAIWAARLLDLNIIEFKNCTMIDCPISLHSGAELIISLSVYIRHSAFASSISAGEKSQRTWFSEGEEGADERVLRERKASLLRLFDTVNLKPIKGVAMNDAALRAAEGEETKMPVASQAEGEDEEALSENELTMIYKKAQQNDRIMSEMEPATSFTFTLRGYQKQALYWMHSLEMGTMSARKAKSMHPLWNQYAFPPEPVDGIIDLTDLEQPFYFNPYSGELSLEFPRAEHNCRGGILADVGMGKTIMLSALIHTNSEPAKRLEADAGSKKKRQMKINDAFRSSSSSKPKSMEGPSATLIVAPTSLLNQWSEELQRSSKSETTKILVWHGQNRSDLQDILDKDDADDKAIRIVITSYGVLASEHDKTSKARRLTSPLFEIEWLRVILDEAHHCKSRQSKTAKAVFDLKARRRWAVTGTPIVNRLEDLYSLLKFLDFRPWSEFSFFRSFITVPFLNRDPKAIEVVQVILESILLRREKNMRDADGKLIVNLPDKQTVVEKLDFSAAERKIYDSIYNKAKLNYQELSARGLVSRNYTHILAMLMRLRRAVLHTSLVLDNKNNEDVGNGIIDVDAMMEELDSNPAEAGSSSNVFAKDTLQALCSQKLAEAEEDEIASECPICFDVMDIPMLIPGCMHKCCKECITVYLTTCDEKGEERRCPTCSSGPINESDLIEIIRPKATSIEPSPTVILRRNDFRSSTKLDGLLIHLRRLRDQDPCFRAVVFSQFTSFLDLIQKALERDRIESIRYDGSMDLKKRGNAIEQFKTVTRTAKVLVISLKAGGVGLNLTTANHVFMMDCWWNAAVEHQAIDRVHRIGQDKTVYVTHFIVSDTIEERILKIQKRKTAIIKEAFKGSSTKEESESLENLRIMFED